MKTRTDQRFNKSNFLVYLKILLQIFPADGNEVTERIIALNKFDDCGDVIWTPFWVSDFMTFCNVDDIKNVYGIRHKTK